MITKYILTFIAVIALLAVIVYGITVYDKHSMIEYTQSMEQQKREAVNDSLKFEIVKRDTAINILKRDLTDIQTQKQILYTVYKDKTKRDISKSANEQGEILKELIEK